MSSGPLTRRETLRLGGAAAASMLLAPVTRATAAAWKPIPVGTQLWCVRLQLAKDIPGTLKALGGLGYQAVELENAFGKSGAEWKSYLDAAGLKACGFHHTLSELKGEKLAASVEFNQAIGNRNLIIRSLEPAVYTSADLLKKTADEVNQVAERLKAHQMRVGYHNHTTDFNRIDGEYWWNRFADQTSKDVILQFDTGNASEMEGVTPSISDAFPVSSCRITSFEVRSAKRFHQYSPSMRAKSVVWLWYPTRIWCGFSRSDTWLTSSAVFFSRSAEV